jgi:hypothetical protein
LYDNFWISRQWGRGEGGRRLVAEAFSSSGRGHIGLYPFFSLSAWLTVADKPRAGGLEFSKLPSVRGLKFLHFDTAMASVRNLLYDSLRLRPRKFSGHKCPAKDLDFLSCLFGE